VYDAFVRDFTAFAGKLTVKDISFVPVSALEGDNVVKRSEHMPWYQGGPLLHHLETVNVGARTNTIDFRFPVQYVVRPNQRFRGYAGTVASGSVKPGEEIVVLPSGVSTRIKGVETFDGPSSEARAGDAVVLTTTEEVDISRGNMIVRRRNLPSNATRIEAYLCWLHVEPIAIGRAYVLIHTTREVQAFVNRIDYRVDVDTMHREQVPTLGLNDIGRVEITTGQPLFFDSYRVNAATGSFILIDPHTNVTMAAGMIRGEVRELAKPARRVSSNVVWQDSNITREARERQNGHRAAVIWFTGLSAAGKTTIAREVERRLFDRRCRTMLLDGDQLRHGLCGDLGFSPEDRTENIRRAGEVARLFFEQGGLVLCAFVSPYREDRNRVRALLPEGRFIEVFVTANLDTRRARDPKGLYARAGAGTISQSQFSGLSAPYEEAAAPDMTLDTDYLTATQAADLIIDRLRSSQLID